VSATEALKKATPGALVEAYLTLRRKRDACRALEKETVAKMGILQGALLTKMKDLKQEAFKAMGQTVYHYDAVSLTVSDRKAFMEFVQENEAFDLLDARAGKEAVELYMAENGGELPPGLTKSVVLKLGVRKA
jgi:hypothetical protein